MYLIPRQNRVLPVFQPVNRLDPVFDRLQQLRAGVPLSVWQDDENFFVEADLPGVSESDVGVTVHLGQLFIRGERKAPEGRKHLFNSRGFGRFERTITLPEDVRSDAVNAELVDGVLKVTLPKRPEAQPKRIAVHSS